MISHLFSLLSCYLQIRPIDKKLEYQIQKLTKVTERTAENVGSVEKDADANDKTDDLLKYRPNPDMLSRKSDMASEVRQLYTSGYL